MKISISCLASAGLLLFSLGQGAQAGTPTLQIIDRFSLPPSRPCSSTGGIDGSGLVVGGCMKRLGGKALGFAGRGGSKKIFYAFPGATGTYARGVNESGGTICGVYYDDYSYLGHGWFLTDGSYSSFDVPDAGGTEVNGINDAGDFTGTYTTMDGTSYEPYLDQGGVLTTFTVDGAVHAGATGISSTGLIAGYYFDSTDSLYEGYLRHGDGTLTTHIVPPQRNAQEVFAEGVNRKGTVVGWFGTVSDTEGFVFIPPHQYLTYAYPGVQTTYFTGINDQNQIAGYYVTVDANGYATNNPLVLQLRK